MWTVTMIFCVFTCYVNPVLIGVSLERNIPSTQWEIWCSVRHWSNHFYGIPAFVVFSFVFQHMMSMYIITIKATRKTFIELIQLFTKTTMYMYYMSKWSWPNLFVASEGNGELNAKFMTTQPPPSLSALNLE